MKRTYDEWDCGQFRNLRWNFSFGGVPGPSLHCPTLDAPVAGNVFQVPPSGSEWTDLPLSEDDVLLSADVSDMTLGLCANRNYDLFTPANTHNYAYVLTPVNDVTVEAHPQWHRDAIAKLEKKYAKRVAKIAAFEKEHGSLKKNRLPTWCGAVEKCAAVAALSHPYFRFTLAKDTRALLRVEVSRRFYEEPRMLAFTLEVSALFLATLEDMPALEAAADACDKYLADSARYRGLIVEAQAALDALVPFDQLLDSLTQARDAISARQKELKFRTQ